MGSKDYCYGCKYLHSEEMGAGGGRWRCIKDGHCYVVVGLFGFMSEDLEGDKPRPINECYAGRNGAPPTEIRELVYPDVKPLPKPSKEVTEEVRKRTFKVMDPLDACTS